MALPARMSSNKTIRDLSNPFWLMMSIGFVGVSLLAGLLTHLQNRTAIDSSEHLFGSVLENKLERLSELSLEYGYWDEAVDNLVVQFDPDWAVDTIGPYLYETLDITRVYVVDSDNSTLFGAVDGQPDDLDLVADYGTGALDLIAKARATVTDTAPEPATGLLERGGSLDLVAAVRMTTYLVENGIDFDRSTDHVIVFVQAFDPAFLEKISASYLLPDLQIADRPPGFWEAGQNVLPYGNSPPMYFLWHPELPGNQMLPSLLVGLGAVYLLMLFVALSFIKKATAVARILEEAGSAATRANDAKSAFLRNVTHEIRTPVNAIVGFAEIMCREVFGPLEPPRYAGYARDIAQAGQHVLELANDLLDLERMEAGEMTFESEPLDANDLVETAVGFVRELAQQKAIAIELQASAGLPAIRSDGRAIRQVMINLLGNAVKFTPAHGRVVCRTFRNDTGTLAFQVEDNGPGVRAGDLQKILQPFGQVRTPDNCGHRGSGLGLPISKKLVEALGGSFRFESTPGTGTTVTIELPIRA